jgi:Domain of unknown function (DUF4160)
LRIGALRVAIYPNDHRPAHVHVVGDGEAVFLLNCPDGPIELRESCGFNRSDVTRIAASLADHLRILCNKWTVIHGN